MSYYWFNKQEILQKAKKKAYSREKAADCYLQNKETIKEKARGRYRNLSEKEKIKLKIIKKRSTKNCFSIKKKH